MYQSRDMESDTISTKVAERATIIRKEVDPNEADILHRKIRRIIG